MLETEVQALWEAQKSVAEDIDWRAVKGHRDTFGFDDVEVQSLSGVELFVDGSFNCRTGSITFNFKVKGVGPITRYDANGTIHGDAGRCHRHVLRFEDCPRRNLPEAVAKEEMSGRTARWVWDLVCSEGTIIHSGQFADPEGKC